MNYRHMPKFETEYDIKMNDILHKMGMRAAFVPYEADFSILGASLYNNMYINQVLQKVSAEYPLIYRHYEKSFFITVARLLAFHHVKQPLFPPVFY